MDESREVEKKDKMERCKMKIKRKRDDGRERKRERARAGPRGGGVGGTEQVVCGTMTMMML